MVNSKRHTLTLLSVLAFIVLPVVSPQETASPDMLWCILCMIPAFVAGGFKPYKSRGYVFPAIWLLLSAFISTFGPYGVFDQRMLKFALFVFFFIFITRFSYTGKDILYIINTYIILSFIVAVLIILSYIFGYPHVDSSYYLGRYSVGIIGLYKNPNYLAAFINIAFFFVTYQLFNKKNTFRKSIFLLVISLTYLAAIYFTGTRAALLTAGVALLFIIGSTMTQRGALYFGTLCVTLVVLVIINVNTIETLLDHLLGHRDFTEDDSRQISWLYALSVVNENPLTGAGMYSWGRIPGTALLLGHLHNIYLEILLNQGIIGFCGFLVLYFTSLNKIKRKDYTFMFAFLFVMTFPLMFQNGYVEANFWRFIIVTKIFVDYCADAKEGIAHLVRTNDFLTII